MTAATVKKRVDLNLPGIEVVQLTATDGETYTSQKFSKVDCAQATCNDASITTSVSAVTTGTTGVITINWDDITDGDMTLTVYGKLGN